MALAPKSACAQVIHTARIGPTRVGEGTAGVGMGVAWDLSNGVGTYGVELSTARTPAMSEGGYAAAGPASVGVGVGGREIW
jgi:hypothetical protein